MSDWFYARGGQQSGPVTFENLKELARSGGLDAKDLVWTSSMKDWQPAGEMDGLITASTAIGQSAPDPSNPYAAPQSAWQEPAPQATGEILPGSEPIDVGACVKRGFELTKRNFATILLVGLAYIGAFIGVSLLGGLIQGLAGASNSSLGESSPNMAPAAIIAVLVWIINQVFSIFLSLGLVRIGLNLVSGKQVSVGQLFGEGGKLLPAIGASILFGLMAGLGFLLLIVPGIYVILRYGQYMNAIVDRNLGVLDSLSYSSSITTNNRLNLFVLGLLSIAIIIAGVLALLVGLIFAYPVVWLAWIVAFRWMQYGHRAAEDHPGTQTPVLSAL